MRVHRRLGANFRPRACGGCGRNYQVDFLPPRKPGSQGERFADGRPKVPDAILDRMKSVTMEEAWAKNRRAEFTAVK
jgi:hypothetical protein